MRYLLASIFLIFTAGAANAGPLVFNLGEGAQEQGGTFDGVIDGGGLSQEVAPGISAELTVSLVSDGGDGSAWTFEFTLANTTDPGVNNRITAIAFDSTPDFSTGVDEGASSLVNIDAMIIDSLLGASMMPQGFGTFDGCASNGGGCQSGGPDGIEPDTSDSWQITFVLDGTVDSFSFDDFLLRYVAVGGEGFTCEACASGVGRFTMDMTIIPEPATWMMMILGFGMIGLQLRRREHANVSLS